MEWLVKLAGSESDLAEMAEQLQSPEAAIYVEGSINYLRSSAFADLTDAREVLTRAQEMIHQLIGFSVSRLGYRLSVTIAGLEGFENREPRTQFILPNPVPASGRVYAPAVRRAGDDPAVSESPFMERWVTKARNDELVGRVTQLIGRREDLTWTELYHIYEAIKNDLGGDPALCRLGGITDAEIERFRRTANHFTSSGIDSRHGATMASPPTPPMSIAVAREIIHRVAGEWLRSKS